MNNWYKESIDTKKLNERSKILSEDLSEIEKLIGIDQIDTTLSDELRWMYFKIISLDTQSDIWKPTLVKAFDNLLSKYEVLLYQSINQPLVYLNIIKSFMIDLKSLNEIDNNILHDYVIDGWIINATVAVYEWWSIAIEKIMKELEDTIALLLSPQDILLLFEWLGKLLEKPIELIDLIIEWLKQQWNSIVKDLKILRDITTRPWFVIEAMKYITAVWIPLLISLLWPWKLLKLLKLDKILPDGLMNKIDWKKKDDFDDQKELPDYLDMKYFENPNLTLFQVEKAMKTVIRSMDVDYLVGNLYRIDRVLDTLRGMVRYLNINDSKIKWMPKWLALDFRDNMIELKEKLDIVTSIIKSAHKKDFQKISDYLEKKSIEIVQSVKSK